MAGERVVDWEALGERLGTLRTEGERGGSAAAREAIEQIIGTDVLRDAVDYYVAGRRGAELVRHVLWQIHPWSAMLRCREIYQNSKDEDERCSAVELLRVVADGRAVSWIPDLLADHNQGVQLCAAGIVDQLVRSRLVDPEDCSDLLTMMKLHPNDGVRERYEFVQRALADRES